MADVVVIGAAGRMGRRLVANVLNTPGMTLAGAVEWSGSEFIGCDAASVAGLSPCGVKITASLPEALEKANAVIDFSTGGTVMENARIAAEKGCAIVVGTTALGSAASEEFKRLAEKNKVGIVFASNFSVGVNLLFYLSKKVAGILSDYDVEIILNVSLDEFEEFKAHAWFPEDEKKGQMERKQAPKNVSSGSNASIVVMDEIGGQSLSIMPKTIAHASITYGG